ncbi:DDE superfamily endonuclease [Elysia marginata]|uniref:DDE superfamily endonuclease n=1 Tax=Elysia marginata TaxID=1093978 RepID=A0AAV4ECU4_9GAST|nr:DDE superfamily endonuclease [Elysia marginata]
MHEVQETEFIFIDEAGMNIWAKGCVYSAAGGGLPPRCRRERGGKFAESRHQSTTIDKAKRRRGRAVRGKRAVHVVQGRRGPNLTLTFAVSNVGGLIYHELTKGGMSDQRINNFIGTVFRLYHPLHACFVIDNAPAHRQAVNLPLPQNFAVRYLPPYLPLLNICENAFALWKGNIKDNLAEVRDHPQRMAALGQLAQQSTAEVTLNRMQADFRGMQAVRRRVSV